MTAALDVAAQPNTGVLACCYDTALACRELEDVAPLLAAADYEDVFSWRRAVCGTPGCVASQVAEVSGPDGEGESTTRATRVLLAGYSEYIWITYTYRPLRS